MAACWSKTTPPMRNISAAGSPSRSASFETAAARLPQDEGFPLMSSTTSLMLRSALERVSKHATPMQRLLVLREGQLEWVKAWVRTPAGSVAVLIGSTFLARLLFAASL